MPRLEIHLLGSPRIELEGVPIEVDTRKATALLAYLAVTGESHSRESLAALMWPEYDDASARAALRRTLSALNKALAGNWLDADRESIGLKRDTHFNLDIEQFRANAGKCLTHGHPAADVCPACLGPLAESAALYRGDFLSGFTLRDSAAFDDWQFFQAESLRGELAGVLERLARCHAEQRNFEAAIAAARRWLALDSLHEPAHRRLMQLYTSSGQRAAALRQYQECARILDEELGVPPLDETTRLYETIKEHRAATTEIPTSNFQLPISNFQPPTSNLQPPAALQASNFPLVGRSTEWAALLDGYNAIGAAGHLLVLDGEAGIGKTRLAEALVDYARSAGATVLAARCYEGESKLAYGPFVEALRATLGQPTQAERIKAMPPHTLSEAARLLPELAGAHPPPPLDSPGAQTRFFDAVHQTLLSVCESPPSADGRLAPAGVLFLDDLHWADESSLDLLTYLVRRLKGRRLCVLATWRSELVTPGHRLRHLVAEARRSGTGTILSLSRLSRAAVLELVSAVFPAAPAPGVERNGKNLAERLYDETEGLPYFLAEYLALIRRGGPESGPGGWSLPGGVRDLLHSRLAAVSETGWQLLQTAAVIGRSFEFDTLREASGRSEEETLAGLETLVGLALVEEMGGGEGGRGLVYDFSHDKLRALVVEETSLARRRRLHRRVAEALVGRARGRRDGGTAASQVAQHYYLAGQEKEAADYFKLAGDHARALYANAEALAHFQSALALGHSDIAALHESIGDLQTLSGDYSAAIASLEKAAALRAGESAVLAAVERKLGNVHHRRGEWEMAESHFRAALNALGDGGFAAESARTYADWSLTAHQQGYAERALEYARRSLELAEAAGDARPLAQAHNILGILARKRNDLEQARQHLERSLACAESLGDPAARVAALNNLALVHGDRGEIERAISLTETALGVCVSLGDRHREAALHNSLADLLHAAGNTEAAMARLKQAVAILAEIGTEAGALQPEIWKQAEW